MKLFAVIVRRVLIAVAITLFVGAYIGWQHSHEQRVIDTTQRHDQQHPATVSPEDKPRLPRCTPARDGVIPSSALIQRRDGKIVRTHDVDKAFDQAAFDAPDIFPGVTGHDHGITVIDFCKEK